MRVEEFGEASSAKAFANEDDSDQTKSEMFSYPATLIILLVAFGALVAAGVPLLLGATAVVGTIGLLGPVSQLHALSDVVAQVVILVGLAVGVDYAMFYLRREMEERDKGNDPEAALDIAAATSGRAVLISGFTVMTAMAGMFLAGNPIFASFGVGTILVVGVAMLGSLTVLPAVLSFLGMKGWTEKGRVPWVAKRRHAARGESRIWDAVLGRVLRRPLVSAILAGGLLVALSIPALGMQFKNPGIDGYSRSLPIMQTSTASRRRSRAAPCRPSSRQGQGRHRAAGAERDEASARRGARDRAAHRAVDRRRQPGQDRRDPVARGQGQWHRRRVEALAGGPARRRRAGDGRQAARCGGRGDRHDGRLEGLPGRHEVAPADRVRLRARAWRSSCCWSRSARSSCRSRRSS